MILYALKDVKTDYFVTRNGRLDVLNEGTQLFTSKSAAARCVKYQIDNYYLTSPLVRSIADSILEMKYKVPRNLIDPSFREICDIIDDIDLKVVKVQLNEKRSKKEI